MTVDVGRLKPFDQWDETLIEDLLTNKLYPTGIEFRWHEGYPESEGCVLILPARYYSDQTDEITHALSKYRWVLGIVTSDEESSFDHLRVGHVNARWWRQTPRPGSDYGYARLFGVGYSPHFRDLPLEPPEKSTDVFLSAQKSNGLAGDRFRLYQRRTEFFETLAAGAWDVELVERDGFAQGDRAEYVAGMLAARVAPAPTGMVSCDSFRFFEALESGAVPIADAVSAADGPTDYWRRLFGDFPFPTVTDTGDLPGIVDGVLKDWPRQANRVAAFWARYKRSLALGLREDLQNLGAL